jgi:hypothetical protein
MAAVHTFNATDYDDALLRLLDLAVQNNVIAVAIAGGGTNYVVGEILTVTGGTVVAGLTALLEVTSVAAGVVDGVRVFSCGAYSANPGNPVSTTGSTTNDATFNLTFSTQNWAVNRNVASSTSIIDFQAIQGGAGTQTIEREVQIQGPGNAGTDEIYVGIIEIRETAVGSFNWFIQGMTGFGSGLDFIDQPGASYIPPNEIPAFVALSGGSIECWFYITPRTLHGVMRIGTTYVNFNFGFLNPYATPAEFPYPLYIGGSTAKWNQLFSESGNAQSGMVDPISDSRSGGNTRGNGGLRITSGVWSEFRNWQWTGATRQAQTVRTIYPAGALGGAQTFQPIEDRFVPLIAADIWDNVIPSVASIPVANLLPVDDSGGNQTELFPTILWERDPTFTIFGELNDIFWGSTSGAGIVSEDRVIIAGEYFRAFQNCNRSDAYSFVFLREDA